jgi:hypothetical protein
LIGSANLNSGFLICFNTLLEITRQRFGNTL